ncbi:MAG: hypothetical protein JWQ96_3373 [Segetibacter sp.]|nr:hypothetical protein [Segetibacter sp.]
MNIKKAGSHQHVMPYLIVEGAEGLIDFLKRVFNAEETLRVPRGEEGIMHAEVKIGDSIIMLADATDNFKPMPAGMFVYVENADETYLEAINEGATSVMEPTTQSYGRAAGVTDSYGNTWWLSSL